MITKKVPQGKKDERSELILELKSQNTELVKSAIEMAELAKNAEDKDVELISLTSHEMKTPLTSIISTLNLILNKKLGEINEKQRKSLSIAFHDANRLNMLIKNMVDISRIEEGLVEYQFVNFNLFNLIKECSNAIKLMLEEKNINLKIVYKKPIEVLADRSKIEQVILNLITNSVRYGKKGGNILISLYTKNGKVIIAIKDDGMGIPKNDILKLFKKNFRAENSVKRILGGLGYGLYISKKILDRHHGEIWVESTLGKGSTFYVSLPYKQKNLNRIKNILKKEEK